MCRHTKRNYIIFCNKARSQSRGDSHGHQGSGDNNDQLFGLFVSIKVLDPKPSSFVIQPLSDVAITQAIDSWLF